MTRSQNIIGWLISDQNLRVVIFSPSLTCGSSAVPIIRSWPDISSIIFSYYWSPDTRIMHYRIIIISLIGVPPARYFHIIIIIDQAFERYVSKLIIKIWQEDTLSVKKIFISLIWPWMNYNVIITVASSVLVMET